MANVIPSGMGAGFELEAGASIIFSGSGSVKSTSANGTVATVGIGASTTVGPFVDGTKLAVTAINDTSYTYSDNTIMTIGPISWADATGSAFYTPSGGTVAAMVGMFAPVRGTGNDAAAIQAAITAAQVTRGTVWLGNYTWTMASGITFDPTRCSIDGAGARLNFTSVGDINCITVTQSSAAEDGAHRVNTMRGFSMYGPGLGTATALYFYTPTGSNWASILNIENVHAVNFKRGLTIGDNGFLITARGLTIGYCLECIYRSSNVNNGENLSFFGCTFFNSTKALQIQGPNAGLKFYSCSFDYNVRVAYSDSGLEFYGCHFESRTAVTGTEAQFEGDNGAVMRFFGGGMGLANADSASRPTWLFTSYNTNGGGRYELIGIQLDNFNGNPYSTSLCNNPGKISVVPVACSITAGTAGGSYVPLLAFQTDFALTLTSNLTIANSTEKNNAPHPVVFKLNQAASGGPYTVTFGSDYLFATTPAMHTNNTKVLLVTCYYNSALDKYNCIATLV